MKNLFYHYFVLPIWNPIKENILGVKSDIEAMEKFRSLFHCGYITIDIPLTEEMLESPVSDYWIRYDFPVPLVLKAGKKYRFNVILPKDEA